MTPIGLGSSGLVMIFSKSASVSAGYFSNAVKNPYVGKLKQQITIRLDEQVIDYFKKMSEETGMPYQNIINYYLLDCVKEKKHMDVAFAK